MKAVLENVIITDKGEALITLRANAKDGRSIRDKFSEIPLDVEIKKERPKRSLSANAYLWVLIDKLSVKTGIPRDEIYRHAIRNVGGNAVMVTVLEEAAEALMKGWETKGLGWLAEYYTSPVEGCANVVLYYGSSTYDKRSMAVLIDYIINEAKDNDIETLPPEELERMLQL